MRMLRRMMPVCVSLLLAAALTTSLYGCGPAEPRGTRHFGDVQVSGTQLIDGQADAVQLRVQGHTTQTEQSFVVEQSDGTDTFTVSDAGAVVVGDALTISEGKLADSTVVSADIKDGELVNADVSAAADIAVSKLEDADTAGKFIVADASNHPAYVAMSGDLALASDGAATIQANAVEEGMIKDGEIVNADVNASAAISATKIADGSVTSAEFQYVGSVTSDIQAQLDGKEPTVTEGSLADSVIVSADIKDDEIVNADVNSSAAISATKIADGSVTNAEFQYIGALTSDAQTQIDGKEATVTEDSLTDSVIVSADIKDDTIVNADVNSAAAISATKIADGSVTNAEFQYVGDVTGLIQAQIDGKEATVTEGSLTDSVILSADIKDDELVNADIKTSAAISATKIADGSVTNAEFQYLGDVTGLLQAQVDGKEATVTEGSLTDSVVVSADIKDDTIVNADVNLTAAISATKLADGSVTNAEFQYLGDVTGLLQAQIDGKEATVTEGSLADSVIVSGDVKDDTLLDADINSAADIAYTKLDDIGVVKWATKAITWTQGAGDTAVLLTMPINSVYFIQSIFVKTTVEWTVTAADDEYLHVGDDLDTDGFLVATHTELLTTFTEATGYAAGWYGIEAGSGGAYTLDDGGPFVYDNAAEQTIDIIWDATGDDLTAGASTVYVVYIRIQ